MNSSLYTEIVMYHAKNKAHYGEMEAPTYVERGFNPSCGDDLTLMVKIEDGIVIDAKYIGDGCAISRAAMSMMIDIIIGKEVEIAKHLSKAYLDMIKGEGPPEELMGDLAVFETLQTMPARVKCGTLGMHCLKVIADVAKEKE